MGQSYSPVQGRMTLPTKVFVFRGLGLVRSEFLKFLEWVWSGVKGIS